MQVRRLRKYKEGGFLVSFPFGQYVSEKSKDSESWIQILDDIAIDRIGIQGTPGTKIKINNQIMHIGRTGLFELETDITKIEIDESKQYIIDYHKGGITQ